MTSIAESAVAAGRGIGRYFSVVGMVPAMVAVVWVAFLLSVGAWTGPIRLERGLRTLSSLGVVQISALIVVALVLGLVVNPFQFTATQWLEGYWGGGNLMSGIAARRINRYRSLLLHWASRGLAVEKALITATLADRKGKLPKSQDGLPHNELLGLALDKLNVQDYDSLIRLDQVRRYHERLQGRFPSEPARVMPTRFGNALRAFEDRAGRQYELDAVVVAPHLSLLGENPRAAYVEDTRQTMDLAVRLWMMALLVTPITAVLLADDGAWLLLTLCPYIVSYLAYRGAISCAQAYGNAVTFQIDLDRFALYQALKVPLPKTSTGERTQNQKLMSLLQGRQGGQVVLRYTHTESPQPDKS